MFHDVTQEIRVLKVAVHDVIWFIVSILIHLGMIYLFYRKTTMPHDTSIDSPFLVVSINLLILAKLIIGPFMSGINMYNRTRFADILNGFNMFDKKVNLNIQQS